MCESDPTRNCIADCLGDADCDSIVAFFRSHVPDTSLGSCIESCNPPKL